MKKYILYSEITGKGEPIVLLHGYLASSHYFSVLKTRLAKTNTVITIDLLGFGKSPKPRMVHSYEAHVAAIHNTLQSLGINTPTTFLGHSMGALIATRYALTHPERVSSLQLFNPPLFTNPKQAVAAFRATGMHYRLILHSPIRRLFWASIKSLPRRRSLKRAPINFTDSVRASYKARETSYRHVILATEFFSDIAKLTIPTLLVVGKYDRLVYLKNLKTVRLPQPVSLHIVDTGHHTPVKALGLTEQLIRSHLLQ